MSLHRLFDNLGIDRFFSGLEDIASDGMQSCEIAADDIFISELFNAREVRVMDAVGFLAGEMLPDFITGVDQNR